jgi:uncharacterized protein
MGRLIFLALAVLALVWLVRGALRDSRPPADSSAGDGELVRCARCGLHLPKSDARSLGGRFFCSDEHARGGPGGS